jgi:hypothetical protein
MPIGIKKTNASIGIPASTKFSLVSDQKMLDCVGLVQYRTSSGIVSFFHSGTGLTGYQKVWHSSILKVDQSFRVLVYVLVLVHVHFNVHVHVHDHDNEPIHVHVHRYGQGQEHEAFNMLSDVHK